ncbi:type III-B CRISPR module RAMP protein Cmr4 [bacterium]|nr:type III-B CRISPR module RAMP protein Cmr4 [bacterium]
MPNNGCLFTFYTLTPLHAGAGDSAGAIDLPIQRERHTEYPVVHSSGIKGALRWFFKCNDELKGHINDIFGKEEDEEGSGKVIFTDAKILFFPVRSSEGVFKWVTSPFVIERLKQDLKFIGISKDEIAVTTEGYSAKAFESYANRLILEDFPVTIRNDLKVLEFFNALTSPHFNEETLKKRLIIVSDNLFKTLVTGATQIIARNVLNDNKTSKNLWYEEVVPADALFYTIMKPAFKGNEAIGHLETGISKKILQLGGNETIGYGLVRMSDNINFDGGGEGQ